MSDSKTNSDSKPHLGIPEAVFVEDVDQYMKDKGYSTAEEALRSLDENYQKYRLMEVNLATKKRRLKQQIPDLKSTLDILKHLDANKVRNISFWLAGSDVSTKLCG